MPEGLSGPTSWAGSLLLALLEVLHPVGVADDRVGEGLDPGLDALVARHGQTALLVAAGDNAIEDVREPLVERREAEFVEVHVLVPLDEVAGSQCLHEYDGALGLEVEAEFLERAAGERPQEFKVAVLVLDRIGLFGPRRCSLSRPAAVDAAWC